MKPKPASSTAMLLTTPSEIVAEAMAGVVGVMPGDVIATSGGAVLLEQCEDGRGVHVPAFRVGAVELVADALRHVGRNLAADDQAWLHRYSPAIAALMAVRRVQGKGGLEQAAFW